MAGNTLRITLTDEQQKQIKDATGKNINMLNIEFASTGHLAENELEQAVGGNIGSQSSGAGAGKITFNPF